MRHIAGTCWRFSIAVETVEHGREIPGDLQHRCHPADYDDCQRTTGMGTDLREEVRVGLQLLTAARKQ